MGPWMEVMGAVPKSHPAWLMIPPAAGWAEPVMVNPFPGRPGNSKSQQDERSSAKFKGSPLGKASGIKAWVCLRGAPRG